MQERERVARIIQAAQETKAEDILVFDMDSRSPITDYVLVCSGRSQAHVRGISDMIAQSLREDGVRCGAVEGYQEGSWVLMDYGVVIVHVFHPETRTYYDLESLFESFPRQSHPPEAARA